LLKGVTGNFHGIKKEYKWDQMVDLDAEKYLKLLSQQNIAEAFKGTFRIFKSIILVNSVNHRNLLTSFMQQQADYSSQHLHYYVSFSLIYCSYTVHELFRLARSKISLPKTLELDFLQKQMKTHQ